MTGGIRILLVQARFLAGGDERTGDEKEYDMDRTPPDTVKMTTLTSHACSKYRFQKLRGLAGYIFFVSGKKLRVERGLVKNMADP